MEHSAKIAGIDQKLSQNFHRALTADKDELFQILQDASNDILLAAMKNPSLDENHLLMLLKRRSLPEQIFTILYGNKSLIEHYQVKFAMAGHRDIPSHIATGLFSQLYIFDLAKLCRMPGLTPDQHFSAERNLIQRIPTQPLGNKLTLARQGTAAVVETLLREGLPPVVDACLDNPQLKEGALHQFIASAAATPETISMIARNNRWKGRPNIRLAILKNPRTPGIWFTLFLPGLPPATIRELLSVPRLTMAQKELVRQALSGKRAAA